MGCRLHLLQKSPILSVADSNSLQRESNTKARVTVLEVMRSQCFLDAYIRRSSFKTIVVDWTMLVPAELTCNTPMSIEVLQRFMPLLVGAVHGSPLICPKPYRNETGGRGILWGNA